jgi:hypothetical protein
LQNFPIWKGRWRQATTCAADGNVTTPGGSEMDIVLFSSWISGFTVELKLGLKLKLKLLIYWYRHVFLRSRLKGRGHFTLATHWNSLISGQILKDRRNLNLRSCLLGPTSRTRRPALS